MTSRADLGRALVDRRSEGGRCELCGRLGSNVHHRMRQGRPWHAANLLRVCGAGNAAGCHGWIETHPSYATSLGLIVPRELDPSLVPAFCKPVLFELGWWHPLDDGTWQHAEHHVDTSAESAIEALHVHLWARWDDAVRSSW